MGPWARLTARFGRARRSRPTGPSDPSAPLTAAYAEQLALLQSARRGLADIVTARVRMEQRTAELRRRAADLHADAERAVDAGADARAREALVEQAAFTGQLPELDAQVGALRAQEDELQAAVQALAARVEALRIRTESATAQHTAAEAQARIGGALAGLTGLSGTVDGALADLEDRTLRARAQADAYAELAVTAAPDGPSAAALGGRAAAEAEAAADAELARLRDRRDPGTPAGP